MKFFICSFSVFVLCWFLSPPPPPHAPPLVSRRPPSAFGGFLCPLRLVLGVGGPPPSPLYLGTVATRIS